MTPLSPLTKSESALVALGEALLAAGFEFVCVTPATHGRVNARSEGRLGESLRDIFGWGLPFAPLSLPPPLLAFLRAAEAVDDYGTTLRSLVRFSMLGSNIYVHSAYPTTDEHAVFFGPDTYRFCALLGRVWPRAATLGRVVDVGCGSGAGGLFLAPFARQIVLADINESALSFARVNAQLCGCAEKVELRHSDVLAQIAGPIDAVIANPPFLVDAASRAYRHGGGEHGTDLALRIVQEALQRLEPGGVLVLYTGAPVVLGVDLFRRDVAPLLTGLSHSYHEIDPDIFGEELAEPAYAKVERIAAVGLIVEAPLRRK